MKRRPSGMMCLSNSVAVGVDVLLEIRGELALCTLRLAIAKCNTMHLMSSHQLPLGVVRQSTTIYCHWGSYGKALSSAAASRCVWQLRRVLVLVYCIACGCGLLYHIQNPDRVLIWGRGPEVASQILGRMELCKRSLIIDI